jgi:hypothetical protein
MGWIWKVKALRFMWTVSSILFCLEVESVKISISSLTTRAYTIDCRKEEMKSSWFSGVVWYRKVPTNCALDLLSTTDPFRKYMECWQFICGLVDVLWFFGNITET